MSNACKTIKTEVKYVSGRDWSSPAKDTSTPCPSLRFLAVVQRAEYCKADFTFSKGNTEMASFLNSR
eukprot:3090471-Amphidinium_carterae.1